MSAGDVIDRYAERKAIEDRIAGISLREAFAGARRVAAKRWRRSPNWVFAMQVFSVGATAATEVCRHMGVDPEGVTAERYAAARESARLWQEKLGGP